MNKVSILDYGIIRIDDDESRHYATSTDIHSLGMALIKPPRSQVAERGIIERMVNSGLVKVASEARGDHLLPMYYSRLAGALYDLNQMDQAPGIEEADVVDVYTFYTFGERVILEAYPHHVRIIDGDFEYWYEVENAPDYLYPSVP